MRSTNFLSSTNIDQFLARAQWLGSLLFQEHRIKILVSGTKPLLRDPGWKSGQYEGQTGIWAGLDGDNVQIKFGVHNIMCVPAAYIMPLRPSVSGQKAIVLTGEHAGAWFVVVSIKDDVCTLRKPEDKKKKSLVHMPLLDLASLV